MLRGGTESQRNGWEARSWVSAGQRDSSRRARMTRFRRMRASWAVVEDEIRVIQVFRGF